uniref:ATP synthase subunit s-like protein (inferred by orthology to a human protein) n=1 Tax=Anisakis simplex TaxID=6269 RepID=A0A0M3JIM0_ANISI
LSELEHLRMLRLAGCNYANDWMMGRIGTMFSNTLEMLDLSDCYRITAKGLAGLKSLKKLRYLRLEGMDHVKVFSLISVQFERFCSFSPPTISVVRENTVVFHSVFYTRFPNRFRDI